MLDRTRLVGLLDQTEAAANELLALDAGDDVDRLAERVTNLSVQMRASLETATGSEQDRGGGDVT
jgi:hypothetical protein